jgi:tetratricopeptide (TPR) repeat protein
MNIVRHSQYFHLYSNKFGPLLVCFLMALVSFQDIRPAYGLGGGGVDPNHKIALDHFKKREPQKVVDLLSPRMTQLSRSSLILLARSYQLLENYNSAIKIYNSLLSKNQGDYEALTYLGAAQLDLAGKPNSDALNSFKNALEANPKYEPVYRELIRYYEMRSGKDGYMRYELRNLLQDLVDKVSTKHEYLSKICEISYDDKVYDLSSKYCKLGMSKYPREAIYEVIYAQTLRLGEDPTLGEKMLKRAADKFKDSELANFSYAQLMDEKKDPISAYTYYKRAAVADPKVNRSTIGLANSAFEVKKFDEALTSFTTNCKSQKDVQTALRKAVFSLRKEKESAWISKYEAALEKCAPTVVGY